MVSHDQCKQSVDGTLTVSSRPMLVLDKMKGPSSTEFRTRSTVSSTNQRSVQDRH